MKGKHPWPPVMVLSAVLGLLLVGCTQASGMGWIHSVVPVTVSGSTEQKATFGFAFYRDSSDPESPALFGVLRGSYHDPRLPDNPSDDVDFKGEGVLRRTASPPPGAPPDVTGCMAGAPTYDSQNPDESGTGELVLIVCDREGVNPVTGESIVGDYLDISIISGPFAGYKNAGYVEGGNITVRGDTR